MLFILHIYICPFCIIVQSIAGRSIGRSLGSLESRTQNHVPSAAATRQRWKRGKGEATGHGDPWRSMEMVG